MTSKFQKDGNLVARDELTVAKTNAALKIVEWSKDEIETGISGNPNQLHIALAEAFRAAYDVINEAVGPGAADGKDQDDAADNHVEEVSVP